MSSPPSHAKTLNSRFRLRPECERKSDKYAAALTFGLLAALYATLLLSFGAGIAVPKGDSLYANGLLAVELRRVSPSALVWEEPKPAPREEARKLLSGEARPDSLVVATLPEPEKPKPVAEKKPDPVPAKKPKPLQKKKARTPPPAQAPVRSAPEADSEPDVAEDHTGSADGSPHGVPGGAPDGGTFGHSSGREGVVPDTKGKILTVLLHAVEKNKRYPLQARRLGHQGRVTLRVSIDARGTVASCSLAAKSGIASLDRATEKLGESLIGLDIPQARGKAVEVLIPVQYALKR